jgi:phage terminase large subunit-like protein
MPAAKAKPKALTDPRAYRAGLVIEAGGRPMPLVQACDPWQREDFEALDGGWQVAAGIEPTYPALKRAWLGRGRGHSKTTDIAVMTSFPLMAAERPLRGYWFASDKDQARLGANAYQTLCQLNPVLRAVLEVGRNTITNTRTGSTLEIMAGDVASSYGLLPDFIINDEVTHWAENSGEGLFTSTFSSAAKRASCFFGVISNAGFADTWQEKAYLKAKTAAGWYFSDLDGPKASWISAEMLAEQREFLPGPAFDRVWLNRWCAAAGDALTEAAVRAAVRESIALPFEYDQTDGRGLVIVAALDLGIKRDHSALIGFIANPSTRRLYHCHSQTWNPADYGGEVPLSEVELAVEQFAYDWPSHNIVVDPWQATGMIQRLNARGLKIIDLPSSPKNLSIWATHTVAAFENRQVSLMPDDALIAQLLKLRIQETPNGFKLLAPRDRVHGHCDLAIAASMAIAGGMENITNWARPWFDDGLGDSLAI